MSNTKRVLVVDLDGTLIKTDMLFENFLGLLKANPAAAFTDILLSAGKLASMKSRLAERWEFEPEVLPYCEEVLDYIRKAKQEGRPVVLATASHKDLAEKIAGHVDLFDEVLATGDSHNLKGKNKVQALKDKYKETGFDYVGNSRADMPVWQHAETAVVVGAPKSVVKKVKKTHENPEILSRQGGNQLKAIIKAIRVHQWVKNLLLFIPIIMAHKLGDTGSLLQVVLGFISFSLCASAVYLLNDMLDLYADRQHPRKKLRPFASGELPLTTGFVLFPCFLVIGALITVPLDGGFSFVLGVYLVLTTLYSFYLKQVAVVDILLLAGLYTIRIFAGGVAAGVPVSHWLLLFSMFMFLSLACAKRVSELHTIRERNLEKTVGRGYRSSDLEQVSSFGSGAGYISVLVLALYITSLDVRMLYNRPEILWLICPVILYWISRVWLLTHRGELHDDPIVFAIKDKISYLVGGICVVLVLLAM